MFPPGAETNPPTALAGGVNTPDAGGQGAPAVPPLMAGIPSFGGPPASPMTGAPSAPPVTPEDPRITAALARLQPQPPVQESPFVSAIKKIAPILGAMYAMHDNAGGAFTNAYQQAEELKQKMADQQAERDYRLATILHQQQQDKIAAQRAAELDQRQREQQAKQDAALARQKAIDTYNFLNKQADNQNWTKNVLKLANEHPDAVDTLGVQAPWGETIPISKIKDLGFIQQDENGQYNIQRKKPPVPKIVNENGQTYSVMIDPDTNQEVSRTWVGEQKQKEPKPPVPQDRYNPDGSITAGYLDPNRGNKWYPSEPGTPTLHAPPGAAQRARQQDTAGAASHDLATALTMVDDADKAGVLGPAAGRIYGQYLAGKVKSTGDRKIDTMLGALRNRITTIKMAYPTAITGTTRAGGATGLVKKLDDVLDTDGMSASMLRGALRDMKSAADERAGDKAAPDAVNNTYIKVNGKWVAAPTGQQ